jgi:hypothetical protein
MRVGVVGHGAVGRRVVRNLVAHGPFDEVVVVTSRHLPEDEPRVRTLDERTLREEADVVVLASAPPQQPLARVLLEGGCAVVATSDDTDDVDALLGLERLATAVDRPLVVGAGAAPGLTGLLARTAGSDLATVDEIHVAIHGTGGPACARVHHLALGSPGLAWLDGVWQERPGGTGRELCWFPDPIGAHDCYRAALADPLLLHRSFPTTSRITARLTATRRDRLTARLPMLRPPHPEALEGAVRVEVRGDGAAGRRESVVFGAASPLAVTTAAVAAATAVAASRGQLPGGLRLLGEERLPTPDIVRAVQASGVVLHRFVGTAVRTSW